MPENEFEKKVASEMQDLRFKPSEKVWLRVEERIKKKKNRRVFVLVFFLAGLALLGYWQRNNLFGGNQNDIAKTEQQTDKTSKSGHETTDTSTINTQATSKKDIQEMTGTTEIDQSKQGGSAAENKGTSVSTKETQRQDENKNKLNVQDPTTEKTNFDDKPEASVVIRPTNTKKKTTIAVESKKTDAPVVNKQPEIIVKQDESTQTVEKPVAAVIDSAKTRVNEPEKKSTEKKDTISKVEQAKEPAKPIVKKDPSGKKWKWGLHITPGISLLGDLSSNSQKNADRLAYQNPVNSGAGVPPVMRTPSDPKAGFALQAGGFAKRQLSKRTGILLGLQYGYYSNILLVGSPRGSLAQLASADRNSYSIYNAGGDTIKYTNQYHFIELPMSFQWQLNKNYEKPFTWSMGFTVGQLVANNAIMYDTAFNGIYRQNEKLLNKTQFSFASGFSWTIANSKQAQWNLGPVINIHLNRLVDNPFDSKGNLFFAGLRTAVLLNQKK
jgi:hypothetical protein